MFPQMRVAWLYDWLSVISLKMPDSAPEDQLRILLRTLHNKSIANESETDGRMQV